jgi:dTMP kinase
MPDRTVLLRLDTETAVERARDRCESPISDRFEAEGDRFQDRIAAEFDRIAAAEPERFVVVDAVGSVDEVHARVLQALGLPGDR